MKMINDSTNDVGFAGIRAELLCPAFEAAQMYTTEAARHYEDRRLAVEAAAPAFAVDPGKVIFTESPVQARLQCINEWMKFCTVVENAYVKDLLLYRL